MSALAHLDTTFVDTYLVDVVLEPTSDHPPIRATRVIVELEHVPDDKGARLAKVHVAVTGEKIVHAGNGATTANTGVARAYGLAEEPTRYNLCRDAVLESLRRHELEVADVSPFAFQDPWETHSSTRAPAAVNLSGAVSRHLHVPGGDDLEDDRW